MIDSTAEGRLLRALNSPAPDSPEGVAAAIRRIAFGNSPSHYRETLQNLARRPEQNTRTVEVQHPEIKAGSIDARKAQEDSLLRRLNEDSGGDGPRWRRAKAAVAQHAAKYPERAAVGLSNVKPFPLYGPTVCGPWIPV